MKAVIVPIVAIAGLLHFSSTFAKETAAATSAPSPLLGRWAVDVSRLPMTQEARPRSVTIAFSDAGGGKWSMQVDIVDARGSETSVEGTYARDGSTVAIDGSVEADVGAVKTPTPNVLVLALGKGGMPASTRIYTVDPDGKHMIETAVSTAGNGLPMMRTHFFNRVP